MVALGLVRGAVRARSDLARLWLFVGRMSSKRQAHKTSTKSSKSPARKRVQAKARVAKPVKAALTALPSKTTRFVKSHPVRVLLGAAAMGVAVAKLGKLV